MINWPDDKKFAFTIFDDTDRATLQNNRSIYGLLSDLGIRTTKSVWAFDGSKPPYIPGVTCSNKDYVGFLLDLQKLGFEIAWHLATWETSDRESTQRGINRFREIFGHAPRSMATHASNEEGIYWGGSRLSGWRRYLYPILGNRPSFHGHDESSPLFWGDLCREHIHYVRNFVFKKIDTLDCCPWMPYHDPDRPFVNKWFASSSGSDAPEFTSLLSRENLDRLEESGGACIVYTHFGKGFVENSEVIPPVRSCLEDVARRNGWFVPVSQLLDFLEEQPSHAKEIRKSDRARLETRWLVDQLSRRLFIGR